MKRVILHLVSWSFAVSLWAEAGIAANPAALERAIEQAQLRADAAALAIAQKEADAARAADPANPALLYAGGLARYAATAPLDPAKDKRAILRQLDEALALLETVHGQPWEAEAGGLRAHILGIEIGLKGGFAGMTLGPKSGRLLASAAQARPASPRISLFRGIGLLNTPKMFGGDPVAGVKLIEQAVAGFATEDRTAAGPHWGRAFALATLGVEKQKSGDDATARRCFAQALALEPDYRWAKSVQQPALKTPP